MKGMKGGSKSLLAGLKNKSPSCYDASMKAPGMGINKDATRSGVAKTPKTLGPRTA